MVSIVGGGVEANPSGCLSVLSKDSVVAAYIRERRGIDNDCDRGAKRAVGDSLDFRLEDKLPADMLGELRAAGYSESKIKYIALVLTPDEIRFQQQDSIMRLKDFLAMARVKRMPAIRLTEIESGYGIRDEKKKELSRLTSHWTQRERDIVAWNLGIQYNRAPEQAEIEDALANQILEKGHSPAKEGRVYAILAHPDWFYKKGPAAVAA